MIKSVIILESEYHSCNRKKKLTLLCLLAKIIVESLKHLKVQETYQTLKSVTNALEKNKKNKKE
jgi:hypothetical protein